MLKKNLKHRRKIKRTLISILQYKGLNNSLFDDNDITLKAILDLLASSQSYSFLLNLEDLWLETHPQNIPGTRNNHNWSRKIRFSFEELSKSAKIIDTLNKINQSRKGNCGRS